MIFILFVFCGLLVLLMLAVVLWLWSLIVTRAPFVPIPKEIIPRIIEALKIGDDSVVYDLGCGDGRVLVGGYQVNPRARYVGIDKTLIPIAAAGVNLWLKKLNGKIKIYKKNFFKSDLSDATHIFTYLFPEIMQDLLSKLERELRPGARLVSCDFKFQNKKPARVINLGRAPHQLGHNLYVYEF